MPEIIIIILVTIFIALGLIGSFFPVVPGTPLVYVGILIFAIFENFQRVSPTILIILGLITLFSLFIDNLASIVGAKKARGSNYSIVGSVVGGFVGLVMFNFVGMLLGIFLGAFFSELVFAKNNAKASVNIGFMSLLGFLAGSLAKILLSFALVIVFLATLFN
ncbi:MAG: DUF456 family protein [Candidatus Moranbacteria bacterium]|nr:DUF456 family protein [Candidatus Moranbacteria bacterium]